MRNWPRLTGLAQVWAGVGVIAVVVPPLAQVGQVARGLLPEVNGTAAVTLAVAFVPVYALMVTAFLMRPTRRPQPEAEHGLPPR